MGERTQDLLARKYLYTLTTSLYYPAALGAVFYFALVDIASGISGSDILLLLGYGGILLTFSIDFLYSVSARDYYVPSLFVSDMLILLLMVSAYTSLLDGLRGGSSFLRFYWSLGLIHAVFVVWDAWLARRVGGNRGLSILVYDLLGLLASVVGVLLFRSSAVAALSVLWACAVLYLALGWPAIKPRLLEGS